MVDLNKLGEAVCELAKQTGAYIKKEREIFSIEKAEAKGYHDFVSHVDKESERILVEGLGQLLPESGFIAEEETAGHSNEDYLWIIDPLDGTTNFIHSVAPYSISIALQYKQKTILGIIYEIGKSELFYSWEGIDAFCNKNRIEVSKAVSLNESLVSTGFPVNDFSRLDNHLKVVDKIVRESHGLRRHGSAATDLAYVAAGRFDGFFEYGLSIWDLAAGAYLVEKAGGKVTDYSGENNYFYGREICAGTKGVNAELINILRAKMF